VRVGVGVGVTGFISVLHPSLQTGESPVTWSLLQLPELLITPVVCHKLFVSFCVYTHVDATPFDPPAKQRSHHSSPVHVLLNMLVNAPRRAWRGSQRGRRSMSVTPRALFTLPRLALLTCPTDTRDDG
jgi:hypothetical protein